MHLSDNRYSENGVKITAPVEFPLEELDMREYSQPDQSEHRVYDLIGCVCHQGSKYFWNTFYYNWVIAIPKLIGLTAVVDEPIFWSSFQKDFFFFLRKKTVFPRVLVGYEMNRARIVVYPSPHIQQALME